MEGLLQAIQADPDTTLEAYLAVRSAVMRLLDPGAMGRFRVMGFGRDWPRTDRRRPASPTGFRESRRNASAIRAPIGPPGPHLTAPDRTANRAIYLLPPERARRHDSRWSGTT